MKRALLAAAVVACVAGFTSIGFSEGDPAKPGSEAAAHGDAAAGGGMVAEKPTKEHADLKRYVGEWESEMSMTMTPGQPPMISKGRSTVRAMGEFWVVEDSKFEMFGMQFEGHGVYGYDATRKKHINFWADTAGSWPMTCEGEMDADGKTLVLKSDGPSYSDPNARMTYTLKSSWPDNDTRVLKMYMPGPDGSEMEVWQMTAKRKK